MEIARKKFQGVLNILSFNRHFYIGSLLVLTLFVAAFYWFCFSETVFWLVIVAFTYGLVAPLLVSAYVYDFSGYYNFNWLNQYNLTDASNHVHVNINAGFDETSFILKNKFPNTNLQVFDFYNKSSHTEPAIVRARKVSLTYPNTQQISTSKIELGDATVDVVFLLSAAHEIRNFNEKVVFLKECHRICKPNGQIIMVEHLRDLPNFLAFSIGFTHFFSKHIWIKAFQEAGFTTINQTQFTPFMSVFNCKNI